MKNDDFGINEIVAKALDEAHSESPVADAISGNTGALLEIARCIEKLADAVARIAAVAEKN